MHKNNLHNGQYNLTELVKIYPDLESHIFTNKHEKLTIDFSNPKAVKNLNTALLFKHYNINFWEFSDDNLCPPIPGRADYLHYLNDLISDKKSEITILDIGTGASCIYPLLGTRLFNWKFIGTDIDENSLDTAHNIIAKNNLEENISLRLQNDDSSIFKNIITKDDKFTATICNPPFYKSLEEASKLNLKKQQNLGITSTERNFSGNLNELTFKGGEKAFLHTYLYESSFFKEQCKWFTTLVSKKENIKSMYVSLKKLKATEIKTLEMKHGNKITRIVAWSFS